MIYGIIGCLIVSILSDWAHNEITPSNVVGLVLAIGLVINS